MMNVVSLLPWFVLCLTMMKKGEIRHPDSEDEIFTVKGTHCKSMQYSSC